MSLRSAWSTLGQPGLHRETVSKQKINKKGILVVLFSFLLLCSNTIITATSRRVSWFGLAILEWWCFFIVVEKHASKWQACWQEPGSREATTDSTANVEWEAERTGSRRGYIIYSQSSPNSGVPLARPHLLNSATNWALRVQMPELMGPISFKPPYQLPSLHP